MSAKRFLKLIEQSGLLDARKLEELRRKISEQKATAAAVAKHLVDKGHLTRFQATQLVSEATEKPAPKSQPPTKPSAMDEDDLILAPYEDGEGGGPPPPPREPNEVVMLEDAGDGLSPVEDAAGGLTPVGSPEGLSPLGSEPLDDLFSDVDEIDPLGDFSDPAAAPARRRRLRQTSVWESKLMLGGGLALALLLILFVVLFVNLSKAPAIDMWDSAMDLYRSGSYGQAQVAFEEFLDDYPEDENASEARVRIVLCKIRSVVRNANEGLSRSQQLLPTIESEEDFSVAREELATILLQIPQSFVESAKNAAERPAKEELVALAEAGLELVNNPSYVPSSRRSSIQTELSRVVEDVNLVHRDINRDSELSQAIADIDLAAQQERTGDAYATYENLIRKYPGLENAPLLIEAVKRVSSRERELVRPTAEILTAETQEPASGTVILAHGGGSATAGPAEPIALRINSAVYGLDASGGEVLWRRPVGDAPNSDPLRTTRDPEADLLLVDLLSDSLSRVGSRQGQLVWRLELGERFFQPAIKNDTILVSTESGRLLQIEAGSGSSELQLQVPQQFAAGPAADPNRSLVFLAGEHSNLYAIADDSFECRSVYYVGHKSGTVKVAPAVHMGHVFVAENAGVDQSLLHVLSVKTDDDGMSLAAVQPPLRLRGNIVVPLEAYGRRLLAVTDRGAVEVFDVDLNKDPPVSQAASLPATLDEPLTVYPATDAGSLWLASDRLTEYRVQVTTKQISRESIRFAGDTFVTKPRIVGDLLIVARKPKQETGVVISASPLADAGNPVWSTRIEAATTHVEADASGEVRAVTSAGGVFAMAEDQLPGAVVQQPLAALRSQSSACCRPRSHPAGFLLMLDPLRRDEIAIFDVRSENRPLRRVELDLPSEATTPAVPFRAGVLVGLNSGDVLLCSAETGRPMATPFRPPLAPGARVDWAPPAAISENEFIIANQNRDIFRVVYTEQPTPHLKQAAAQVLPGEIAAPLAFQAGSIFAITRSAETDSLLIVAADSLEVVEQHDLQGDRVTWGPEPVAGNVFLVTNDSRVHCFTETGEAKWSHPGEAFGRPAGLPLADTTGLVFASRAGKIWRLSSDLGETVARLDVGERLSSSVARVGADLLVGGEGGTLFVRQLPE